MTQFEEEIMSRVSALGDMGRRNEANINAVYHELNKRIQNQKEKMDRLENIVDAAIITAVHELIDYLRHDDIQSLDEKEFAESIKKLIYEADTEVFLPF